MVDFHSLKGSGSFYFVRHGESEGNKDGIMQGHADSPLTEEGRGQAREAGRWFEHRNIRAILTSPLSRARETAEIIARTAGITEVRSLPELMEIDTGILTGLSLEQSGARYPEEWLSFQRESWEGVSKAEKIDSLLARAETVWRMLFTMFPEDGGNVLSVTHGGFLQWIIRSTLGGKTWMPLFSAATNCCISRLRVDNRELEGAGWSYYATWMMVNIPLPAARFYP